MHIAAMVGELGVIRALIQACLVNIYMILHRLLLIMMMERVSSYEDGLILMLHDSICCWMSFFLVSWDSDV